METENFTEQLPSPERASSISDGCSPSLRRRQQKRNHSINCLGNMTLYLKHYKVFPMLIGWAHTL